METGYSKWRKLDNAALAFPLVTDKNDTRVFRFYCQLKEKVNSEILQQALDQTMEKYPLFQAVLRKGLFWFYLERRDIHAIVKKEKRPPCSSLYIPDQKTLLFQVSYYKNRINFEVYHALTDGTGAMNFLSELVQNYLILAHPAADLPWVEQIEETTPGAQEEDSFSQYYSSDIPKNKEKKPAAVKLKGEKLLHADMQITEVVIPVKETLAKARSYSVSITVLLTAMLLCSIHEEIPKNRQKKPVALMIPVNLRNYFPSQSMGNFFGWIEVGYTFSDETIFQDVLYDVKKQFKEKLVKDKIAMDMNGYVRLEKNLVIRAVPLEIKRYFMMAGATLGSRSITAVYSNIGILRFPEAYKTYIERFGIFASTNSLQLCSCSYEDQMVLGFTSKIPDDSIQKNFMRMLHEEEIPSMFPVTEQTAERWRECYNQRMKDVDNAATLENRDTPDIVQGNAYFIHRNGTLLGIGWIEGNKLRAIASMQPGAGKALCRAMQSLIPQQQMTLEVASTNQKAIALYERLGLIKVEELSRWYRVK